MNPGWDREWRLQRFNEGESDKITPEYGYNERPISWFQENVLPDFLQAKKDLDLGDTLLDVGCAYGYFTKVLSEHFERIIGIDFAPARIEGARIAHPAENIKYEVCDITKWDTTVLVDSGISMAVYQHIDPTNGDRKRAFENTFKAISKYLVLYDEEFEMRPNVWDGFYEPLSRPWIEEQLKDVCTLESCGLTTRGLHGESEFRWVLKKI